MRNIVDFQFDLHGTTPEKREQLLKANPKLRIDNKVFTGIVDNNEYGVYTSDFVYINNTRTASTIKPASLRLYDTEPINHILFPELPCSCGYAERYAALSEECICSRCNHEDDIVDDYYIDNSCDACENSYDYFDDNERYCECEHETMYHIKDNKVITRLIEKHKEGVIDAARYITIVFNFIRDFNQIDSRGLLLSRFINSAKVVDVDELVDSFKKSDKYRKILKRNNEENHEKWTPCEIGNKLFVRRRGEQVEEKDTQEVLIIIDDSPYSNQLFFTKKEDGTYTHVNPRYVRQRYGVIFNVGKQNAVELYK